MKILFLTTAFNSMSQRAWIELDQLNHQVKVHIAIDAKAMETAVIEFQPELIIAPYLLTKIPESIWNHHVCLVIHPGIVGDRGASSLDWAILNNEKEWGVTILQATGKMDDGPVWSSRTFPMRNVNKAHLYRHEVTQTAMTALLEAVDNYQKFKISSIRPFGSDAKRIGKWNRRTSQADYQFSWNDKAWKILNKLHAADSTPGVLVTLFDNQYYAFGGCLEDKISGEPGKILAKRNGAICIGTSDKAIWLTHLRSNQKGAIKLPATQTLQKHVESVPISEIDEFENLKFETFREIRYEEEKQVGIIYFDFYNGAMDKDQCNRLRKTINRIKQRPVKIILLMGGSDLWSNGIHLNIIENSSDPAEESWNNINAFNDLILEIIESPNHYIISALHGNAGAGGVPFALSADKVLARSGIVLNPHTRKMGLYGSEYWTYLLPKRIGIKKANLFTQQCLPWGTKVAKEIGLIDDVFGTTSDEFRVKVKKMAMEVATLPYFDKLLLAKQFQRKKDERIKPLAKYREEELVRMWINFFENDNGFSEKRFRFVHKIYDPIQDQSIDNKDWYSSRRKIYRRRKSEPVEYKN